MKFRKKQVGGFRPICTGSPAIGVVGGFNLNKEKVNYPVGVIIPSASLAEYDETSSRQVVVLKASRVVAIDATDAKKVSLQNDEFLSPIFMVGDHVAMNDSGNFEDTVSITKIINDRNGFVVVLDKAIAGLKVGDALFEVIEGTAEGEGKAPAVFPIEHPQGITVGAEPMGTYIGLDEVSVDVAINSKGEMYYKRRIPPSPEKFIQGMCLKDNPNIQFTDSY